MADSFLDKVQQEFGGDKDQLAAAALQAEEFKATLPPVTPLAMPMENPPFLPEGFLGWKHSYGSAPDKVDVAPGRIGVSTHYRLRDLGPRFYFTLGAAYQQLLIDFDLVAQYAADCRKEFKDLDLCNHEYQEALFPWLHGDQNLMQSLPPAQGVFFDAWITSQRFRRNGELYGIRGRIRPLIDPAAKLIELDKDTIQVVCYWPYDQAGIIDNF